VPGLSFAQKVCRGWMARSKNWTRLLRVQVDGRRPTADGRTTTVHRLSSALYRLPSHMTLRSLTPLSSDQAEIQRLAREFAQNEIAPHAAEWDRNAHFEPNLIKQMGDLGFLGMLVPEEHGGLGLDNLTYLIALEE